MNSELDSVNGHRPTGKEVQTCSIFMPEIDRHKATICLAAQINLATNLERTENQGV